MHKFDSRRCPHCGAEPDFHQKEIQFEWFGIGENESCILCGSEYEYWHEMAQKPMINFSIEYLTELASEVEDAYSGKEGALRSARTFTHFPMQQNRDYLQRINEAISAARQSEVAELPQT